MSEDIPLLDNARIAAPCPANWNEMVGGDRVRYCRSCEKNVYNLSEMSKNDAEKLLKTHEGHLCVRYYRRNDGTIMTNDCPVGLRTIRKVYLKTAASAAALCGLVFGAMASMGTRQQASEPTTGSTSFIPPSRLPTPTVAVPPPHLDPERGQTLGGVMAVMPREFTMGEPTPLKLPELKKQTPKIATPIAEVSDNTDEDDTDDDDTGF